MSLIHKALKKGEMPTRTPEVSPSMEIPEEALIPGHGGGSGPMVRPVTWILGLLVVVLIGYVAYQRWGASSTQSKDSPVAVPIIPPGLSGQAVTEQTAETAASTAADVIDPAYAELPPRLLPGVTKGEEFFRAGAYSEALSHFMGAAKEAPLQPVLWNNIGVIHRKLGDLEQAAAAYQKALEIEPAYAEALNNMGMIKFTRQDPLAAAVLFRQAIQARPDYADAHFNLAVLMEAEGNYRSAVAEYKAFLTHAAQDDPQLLEAVRYRIEEMSP
ncbi:MAG: tetratricopeptide repeat protein [Deltaproteobacteria bacterium]|nr:tetratricopeptide repeat protein [Deltaproteobacteria bacterium]